MIFFADENISSQLVKLLEAFDRENEIKAHTEHFSQGTPDTIWISEVAGWMPKPAILGGDGRILRNPAELAALKESGLTFVFLASGWTNLRWEDQAWKIIKCWPDIVRNVATCRFPSVLKVTINGKVEKIEPLKGF